jgi:hypothetical protein
MVSFFPKPYPDEILYSIIARYHIRSANTSPKVTLTELFNSSSTVATADLPSHLNRLNQNLQLFSNSTVEELIDKYTLYPFYSVFLPPKRAIQVKESMKAKQGGDIHTRAGIMASSITMPRYFRFCPNCLEQDLRKYGEVYWHRLHQTPGVLVCPIHTVILNDSTVPIQGFNKHEYLAASLDNCFITPKQQIYKNDTLEKLLRLAQDISWLMNTKLAAKESDWLRRRYIALLIEKGLATATGRVYQKKLLDNFLFFYGHEMLEAIDSRVDYKEEHHWLFGIVRKHRKSFHPIRHLLMIRFLAGSVAEFFNLDYGYKPFGDAPWLCLNAAADHYLQPVVTELTISNCYDTKKPVGTFRCLCGMIYCRTGPDETEEDQYRIGKVKAYGTVWEHKLRELVEVQKLGLRATARQLKVDARTVKRYALRLKLDTSWQSSDDSKPVLSQEQREDDVNSTGKREKRHRETWLTLQREHPEASKTTLRQMAPATYAWLYRNDREWLNQNSPTLRVPVSATNRVDWHERDKLILAQVMDVLPQLLKAEKPVRITTGRIGKTLDVQALLEKHIDKMPLTKAYLESVSESIENYQIRRIKWAIVKLEQQGQEVQPWKVVRMAGLGEDYSQKVQEALEDELYRESSALPSDWGQTTFSRWLYQRNFVKFSESDERALGRSHPSNSIKLDWYLFDDMP